MLIYEIYYIKKKFTDLSVLRNNTVYHGKNAHFEIVFLIALILAPSQRKVNNYGLGEYYSSSFS